MQLALHLGDARQRLELLLSRTNQLGPQQTHASAKLLDVFCRGIHGILTATATAPTVGATSQHTRQIIASSESM